MTNCNMQQFYLDKIRVLEKDLERAHKEIEYLKMMQSASFESMGVFDENNNCISVNEALLENFGYNKEDIAGMSSSDFLAPSSRCLARSSLSKKISEPSEVTMVRKNGATFPALLQSSTTEYKGKIVRIDTCRDISHIKAMQQELLLANSELEAIFSNSMIGIVLVDKERKIIRANKFLSDLFGYFSPDETRGLCASSFYVSADSNNVVSDYYRTTLTQSGVVELETKFRIKGGEIIDTRVVGKAIDSENPPDLNKGVIWLIDDITSRKKTQRRLERTYAELDIFFNNSMVGVVIIRNDRKIYRANQHLADILGYSSPKDMEGKCISHFHLSEEKLQEFGEKYFGSLIKQEILNIDFQLKKKSGEPVWVNISGKAIHSSSTPDCDQGIVWILCDITDRKDAEKQLVEMANTDPLTGVNNRRNFLALAQREWAAHNRENQCFSVLMLDIDHFKHVNDTFGHPIGDLVLKSFTFICTEILRAKDIIGRIGGEEFVIMVTETNAQEARIVAERIRHQVETITLNSQDETPAITVSIGVSVSTPNVSLEELMKQADQNLYVAKKEGRNLVMSGPCTQN